MDLDIPSRDQRRKLARKQFGIGARNVDVAIEIDEKRRYDFLPSGNGLDLVEEDIRFSVRFSSCVEEIRIERVGTFQARVGFGFKTDIYDVVFLPSVLQQIVLYLLQ